MRLCKLFAVVFVYLFFDKTYGQTPGLFSSKEAVQLKAMLKLSLQQNKQLQAQNNRLKLIWSGIKKLCSSITPPVPCECEPLPPQKHKALLQDRHSVHQTKAHDNRKDISPPAVEFYKQDNGNIINSAIYNIVNEPPTSKPTQTSFKDLKNTESFSPIQEVLQDLSIVGYVNKTVEKMTPPSYAHSHSQNAKGLTQSHNQNSMLTHIQNDKKSMLSHNQNDGGLMISQNQLDKDSMLSHNQNDKGFILSQNQIDEGLMLKSKQNDKSLMMSQSQNDKGLMMSQNQIDKGLMLEMLDPHIHQKVNSGFNQSSHASHDKVMSDHIYGKGSEISADTHIHTAVDQGIQYVTGLETHSPNQSSVASNNLIESSNNDDTNIILNNLLLATEQSIQQKQMKGSTDRALLKGVKDNQISAAGQGQPKFIQAHGKSKNPTDSIPGHDRTRDVTSSQRHRLHRNLKLVIKAVSSEGLERNSISVTVRYIAPYDHTTEWLQLQENGATTRTSGVRSMTRKDSDSEFSSNMVFVDANATKHALFRLFGNNKSISIQFNLTELKVSGEQLLPNFENDINNLRDTVMAPRGSDMEINLELRGSPTDNPTLLNTEIFFTGLNTTTRPPTVFEIVHFNSEGVDVLLKSHTKTTTSLKITLKRPYIDYGGILTVRLPQTVGGYLDGYYYGHMIRVLEFYTQEVIPFGHLGVYYLPSTTLVQEPSHSILCAAMGNPPPDVVILKVTPEGVRKETLTETIMLDTVTNMKSLTLYSDKPESSEGRYICRASIGSEVVESETEAMVVQRPVFDDVLTSVISNSSVRVTVSCQATGKPRPQLEMRLYEEHGPDLAKTGKYKTSYFAPDNDTSQLTLTVSSSDKEIHTVYCVAKQNILDNEQEHYKKVVVFPQSEVYTNWYLYIRLLRMTGG